MHPWHDWYHVMCNTYGTWLRGDPRGWRTRHHREHVDGDYRHPPPPETSEKLYQRSLALMKRSPIHLSKEQRAEVVASFVRTFDFHAIDLQAIALDDHHLHLLARFPDHNPRKWTGIAKKTSARLLSDAGATDQGGL